MRRMKHRWNKKRIGECAMVHKAVNDLHVISPFVYNLLMKMRVI